ncbi:WD40 repeat-containing protein HOS15-like isoform X1 [Dioscorea cayenensis subsp. rotundata]|uniref:WD40 repeat-containing protein HOS15-like isoform X1 n=1 Tax=Dioscorea cayennensis subsp. rotundata TaxID=55577 RepID=A0AB40C879_DIOCR|nr:WD40 repeat-containing protein HOS15-like isoform X1 [Dioscorea cayenensis subsp. rotundata]
MEPDSNCSVGTSELPLKNPMPPLRRSPPSPPNPHIPSAKLISFPNVDVFGKLTTNQLNVLIFQYFQAKGFKHAAFAFENEAKIEKIPIDESTIGNGALPSFVHKGLRYTQLEANIHASDANSFVECYRLEPLDVITNSAHELSKIIKNMKENTMWKRKHIDYSVSNQEQESNKQERKIAVYGGRRRATCNRIV